MTTFSTFNITLDDLRPELLSQIASKTNFKDLDQLLQKNPNLFISQLVIYHNELNLAEKRKLTVTKILNKAAEKKHKSLLLNDFTFTNYKMCLLVKHPRGLGNLSKISKIYSEDGFTRPMYWNETLKGWVASTKDESKLLEAGAIRYIDPDILPMQIKDIPLKGFTFQKYKKCLLVKNPKGLNNSANIEFEFKLEEFSRSMYWNETLQGWVASTKDEKHLLKAGASSLISN